MIVDPDNFQLMFINSKKCLSYKPVLKINGAENNPESLVNFVSRLMTN